MSTLKALELTLPGGSKFDVTMPPAPDHEAWLRDGNNVVFRDFIAFYDPATRTGAIYSIAAKLWNIAQPIGALEFWKLCKAGDSTGRFSPSPRSTEPESAARVH